MDVRASGESKFGDRLGFVVCRCSANRATLGARCVAKRLFGADRSVLFNPDTEGDPILFGSGAGLVRSAALLRLCVSPCAPPGLLAIGARKTGKFHPGQGSELLGFLARSLEVVIAGWLDLPTA